MPILNSAGGPSLNVTYKRYTCRKIYFTSYKALNFNDHDFDIHSHSSSNLMAQLYSSHNFLFVTDTNHRSITNHITLRNWAYFCSTGSSFWDIGRFSKVSYLGMKLGLLTKIPKLIAYILSFYPNASKLSLFSLYSQRFPTYGPIFKIAIFGHETLAWV